VFGLSVEDGPDSITLSDAFQETLEDSRRTATRDDWLSHAADFVDWVSKVYPLCTTWQSITRAMIRSYIQSLGNKAPNTIRIKTQPLRQTSRYMFLEYDCKDIACGLGSNGTPVRKTSDVLLADVRDFLNWILENDPHWEVGPALQGLAGLQLQEAQRLTWSKVDLDRGLIEISGVVKNDYRERTIPVCNRVIDALKRAKDRQQQFKKNSGVIDLHGHVIVGKKGLPFADHRSYSRVVRGCIKRWNPQVTWPPKDLRNCIITFAEECGLQISLFDQYLGHQAKTVSDMSYKPRLLQTFTKATAKRQEEALDIYRRQLIDPIEAGLRGFKPKLNLQLSCNSPSSEGKEQGLQSQLKC
jgi:integrase